MEQLLWMWNLLPAEVVSWILNLVIIAGIVGVLAGKLGKWIPIVGVYAQPLKVIGFLVLLVGIFFKGGEINNEAWQAKVKSVEEEVKKAEARAGQITTVVEERVVEKTKVIKEKAEKQIEYIDRVVKEKEEVKVFVENCPLPQDIIIEHNKAATPPGDRK